MNQLRPLLIALALLLPACGSVHTMDTSPERVDFRPEIGHVCTEITQRHYEVLRVIDGDTYEIHYDGEKTLTRMAVIDAPERGRPGADEATAALEEMILGRVVRIKFVDEQDKRDNFGRPLIYTHIDGVEVGAELLRRGLVGVYEP